jgi:hypothetical protein
LICIIHFFANNAFGAIGGLKVFSNRLNLRPDAISGVCSSSPLQIRELSAFTDTPVFNSANSKLQKIGNFLMPAKARKQVVATKLKTA